MSWEYLKDDHGEHDELSDAVRARLIGRTGYTDTQLDNQKAVMSRVMRALDVTFPETIGTVLGWARAIVDHVKAGGRVVFVDADGKERVLKVKVK